MRKLQYLMLAILALFTVASVSANDTFKYLQQDKANVVNRPSNRGQKVYQLHYGQKVKFFRDSRGFSLIEAEKQSQGWIRSAALVEKPDMVRDVNGKVVNDPSKAEANSAIRNIGESERVYMKDKSQLVNEYQFLDQVVEPEGSPYSVNPLDVDAFMKEGGLKGELN